MPGKAAIYGNILSDQDRRLIEGEASNHREQLLWLNDTTVNGNPADLSLIFVDLDNPLFRDPEFLISLSDPVRGATLIGKFDQPTLENTLQVSKLGVAQVLTPDQCLKRLDQFLKQLESVPPSVSTPATQKINRFTVQAVIGSSSQTAEIRNTIKLLSEVDFPSALILGETGTGKSLICKVLHHSGLRAPHNLVEVNCSAIPDELFESELFGHVKGAFTGAVSDKPGLFEFAKHGTIFLDEVGTLSASAQAKLLKILEDKKLRRVGAVEPIDIDVRVVAATNRDLEKEVAAGNFREDLYYRLNLLTITIPPLRTRPEDIPAIVEHYLEFYCTNYSKPGILIHPDTMELLRHYLWPGNVRELCNVLERAVLLNKTGVIASTDINIALKTSRISVGERRKIEIDVPPQGISLEEVQLSVVKQILNMCNWNKSEAARILRISRPRLRRILEENGLDQNRRSSS
jgi:transcriptional regulator with PAS, ATPase and Fis domain